MAIADWRLPIGCGEIADWRLAIGDCDWQAGSHFLQYQTVRGVEENSVRGPICSPIPPTNQSLGRGTDLVYVATMDQSQMKARTFDFGQRVIDFCRPLLAPLLTREMAMQLLDAGTSVGANYRSACRSRSHKEFIAKLGVAIEQADESEYWLAQLLTAELGDHKVGDPLRAEANEITAILVASRKTAEGR